MAITNISDAKSTAVLDAPLINLFPLVEDGDVKNVHHAINHNNMKGVGKVVLKIGGGAVIPVMAKTEHPEDSWYSLLDDTEIATVGFCETPTPPPAGINRMSDRNVSMTGGNSEPYIPAIIAPVVTLAELTDAGHVVNDTFYSGKDADAMVLLENAGVYTIVLANGPAVTDGWTGLEGTAHAVTGTPLPEGRTGRISVVTSTALQGATATTVELTDKNGYINRVPKARGLLVKDTTTGSFMVASGPAPLDTWESIDGGTRIYPA